MEDHYSISIKKLVHINNGFHFGALHTSEQQLKTFRIEDMAGKIAQQAPALWHLMGLLLAADRNETRRQYEAKQEGHGENDRMAQAVDEADEVESDIELEEAGQPLCEDSFMEGSQAWVEGASTTLKSVRAAERREALETIVRFLSHDYVIISNRLLLCRKKSL